MAACARWGPRCCELRSAGGDGRQGQVPQAPAYYGRWPGPAAPLPRPGAGVRYAVPERDPDATLRFGSADLEGTVSYARDPAQARGAAYSCNRSESFRGPRWKQPWLAKRGQVLMDKQPGPFTPDGSPNPAPGWAAPP